MRVLVVGAAFGNLNAVAAGQVVARGWAVRGAQVALVPMATHGADLAAAVEFISPGRQYVDLAEAGEPPINWGGDVVVDPAELGRTLTGLTGLAATTGRDQGWPLERVLAEDESAAAWALELLPDQPDAARLPGSGAHAGLGLAAMAAGSRLISGPKLCAELAHLGDTIGKCDLVVATCDSLDFGSFGGPVLAELMSITGGHGAPLVVLCRTNFISARELRAAGIESAHSASSTADQDAMDVLRELVERVSSTWNW